MDLFVKVSITTGGRLDSICHIKVKDINLRTNSITITDRKKEAANKGDARYSGFFNNKVKSIITAQLEAN